MKQSVSTCATNLCDYLQINKKELGAIIHEDPSWFNEAASNEDNFLQLDYSPIRNSFEKRYQLATLLEYCDRLSVVLGSDADVVLFLNRPRKKLGGRSFATIAKASPSPLPDYNGLQDLIEHIQKWFERKAIY